MLAGILMALLAADPSGTLAYTGVGTDASSDVYVLDVATRVSIPLGMQGASGAAVWSPTGQKLAVASDFSGETRIAVYDMATEEVTPIGSVGAQHPVWSAVGNRIAYQIGEGDTAQVGVYDLNTDAETIWGSGATGLLRPQWLRDGRSMRGFLLFANESPGFTERAREWLALGAPERELIMAVQYESGSPSQFDLALLSEEWVEKALFPVIPSPTGIYAEWNPQISPNHDYIAFETNDGGDPEIFFYNGGFAADVSNHRADDWNPVWSPNSDWLLFESFREGSRALFRVHRETNRVYALERPRGADCREGAWSQGMAWIAYTAQHEGQTDLYVTNIEDGTLVRLTNDATVETRPAWRPGLRAR